jgi:hypothetical protein
LEKAFKIELSPIFPGARKEISSNSASKQKLEWEGKVDRFKRTGTKLSIKPAQVLRTTH